MIRCNDKIDSLFGCDLHILCHKKIEVSEPFTKILLQIDLLLKFYCKVQPTNIVVTVHTGVSASN